MDAWDPMAAHYYHPQNTYVRPAGRPSQAFPGMEYVKVTSTLERSFLEAFLPKLLHARHTIVEGSELFLGFDHLRAVATAMSNAPAGTKLVMVKKH